MTTDYDNLELDDDLYQLPLYVRTINALLRSGISTVGQLLDLNIWTWVDSTHGAGFKTGEQLVVVQQELKKRFKKGGRMYGALDTRKLIEALQALEGKQAALGLAVAANGGLKAVVDVELITWHDPEGATHFAMLKLGDT